MLIAFGGLLFGGGAAIGDPAGGKVDGQGADSGGAASGPARDLVLITIDTLRFDALGFHRRGQEPETGASPWTTPTPALEALAASGRIFDFAHAHNPLTLPSHASILTGLYPYQHGVRENAGFVLSDEIPTLATHLRDAGFATAAFVSAYVLDARFGLARGFETYGDRIARNTGKRRFQVSERRGDAAVAEALEWWRSVDDSRRRFLWLHVFDPHAPYAPPEPFASDHAEKPYRGEVAAVDHFLSSLLAEVGSDPLVLLTADHGESLGEHGELTHGLFAYGSTLRVPLVVSGPGVEPGRDDRLARHVDILPTALDALGLDGAEPGGSHGLPGDSLLKPVPGDGETTSYFEALSAHLNRGWAPLRGLVRGRLKVIDLPIPELYDLEADPGETTNLASSRRRELAALRALLPEESEWPPKRGSLSSEEAARLRSLGYLADSAPTARRYGPDDDPKRLVELDARIQRFSELYALGRLEPAVAVARELVELRPEMPVGHTQLAEALLELGRTDEALEAMTTAYRKGWASAPLIRQLGLTLAEVGRASEALTVLDPPARSGDAEARSIRGLALSELGRLEEAESELRAVLEELPEDASTLERLSVVALRRERPKEAEEWARRAVASDANRAPAWNSLGVALMLLDRPSEALDAWQRCLEVDPSQFDTLFNLGMQAARLGRTELARQALGDFLVRAPRDRYADDLPKVRAALQSLR